MSDILDVSSAMSAAVLNRTGRRRWFVCSQLALIIMVNYLDRGNIGVVLPTIQKEFALSNAQLGLIMSSFQWVYALSNVVAGFAVDLLGPRWLIVGAAFGWTLCAASTGLASGLGGLVIARALLGFMESPMFPAGIKIVSAWFPDQEKAVAIAVYETATSAGTLLAPLLAAFLTQHFGWRPMFIVVALLTLPLLFFWLFFYRDPEDDPKLGDLERGLILSTRRPHADAERPTFSEWTGLFRHYQTWVMIGGGACLAGAHNFLLWLPNYLQIERRFTLMQTGEALSFLGLFHIAGVILGSIASDWLVRRVFPVIVARRLTLSLAAALGGATLFLLAFTSSNAALFTTIALGNFLLGLGVTSWWALVPVIAPQPRIVASLGSLQNGGLFLGGAIMPLASGWLLDHHYGYKPIMAMSAGFGLCAALLYGVALRRPIGRRESPRFSHSEC